MFRTRFVSLLVVGQVGLGGLGSITFAAGIHKVSLEGESLHAFAENHEDPLANFGTPYEHDPLDRPPAAVIFPRLKCTNRRRLQTGRMVCGEYRSPAYTKRVFEAVQWGEWKESPWNESTLREIKMNRYGYNFYRYVLMYDHFEDQPWMRLPNIPSFVECRASDRLPIADISFSFRKTESWKSRVGLSDIDLVVAKAGVDYEEGHERDEHNAVKINGWATGRYAIHTPEIRTMTERGIIYLQTYNTETKKFGFLSKSERNARGPENSEFTWRNLIDVVPVVGIYLELQRSYRAWQHYPEIFNRAGANPVVRLEPTFIEEVPEKCKTPGVNSQALIPDSHAHVVTKGKGHVTDGEVYSSGL